MFKLEFWDVTKGEAKILKRASLPVLPAKGHSVIIDGDWYKVESVFHYISGEYVGIIYVAPVFSKEQLPCMLLPKPTT